MPTSEKTAPWLEITQQWFDDVPSWDFLAMCDDMCDDIEGQMILFRNFPIDLFPPIGKAWKGRDLKPRMSFRQEKRAWKGLPTSAYHLPFTYWILLVIRLARLPFSESLSGNGSDLTSGIHMKPD